jgi:putative tricarboxylic transport membrane protein
VLALAALVGWGSSEIPASTYAKVSPAVVPWIVTAALAILGGLLTVSGLRGGWVEPSSETEGPMDRSALVWLLAGLALNLVLIDGVSIGGMTVLPSFGFIIASTVLFTTTARAFGSTAVLRDAGIGLVLATSAYVLFDRVLGYRIGSGFIERLL